MGMNIYTLDKKHIGKRYANGWWCWDCRLPMREGAPMCEHMSVIVEKHGSKWAKHLTDNKFNPAFRELGFDKSEPRKRTGVDGASGFIWRLGELGDTVDEVKETLKRRRFVLTEYGARWTIQKFWDMFLEVIEESDSDYEFS